MITILNKEAMVIKNILAFTEVVKSKIKSLKVRQGKYKYCMTEEKAVQALTAKLVRLESSNLVQKDLTA